MLGLRPRLRTRSSLYDLIGRRLTDDEELQRDFEERLDDSIDDEELPPLSPPTPSFSRPQTPRPHTPFISPLKSVFEENEAPVMAPVSFCCIDGTSERLLTT